MYLLRRRKRFHTDNPVVTFSDPDIIKVLCADRFHKSSNIDKSFIHHFLHNICSCRVECDLDSWIFFLKYLADLCDMIDCVEFTTTDRNRTFDHLFISFKFLDDLIFKVDDLQSTTF